MYRIKYISDIPALGNGAERHFSIPSHNYASSMYWIMLTLIALNFHYADKLLIVALLKVKQVGNMVHVATEPFM